LEMMMMIYVPLYRVKYVTTFLNRTGQWPSFSAPLCSSRHKMVIGKAHGAWLALVLSQ